MVGVSAVTGTELAAGDQIQVREGHWLLMGATNTQELQPIGLQMILCIRCSFPVYMIPSTVFFRLSLFFVVFRWVICLLLGSLPHTILYIPDPRHFSRRIVPITSCCRFSAQEPPLVPHCPWNEVLIFSLASKVPLKCTPSLPSWSYLAWVGEKRGLQTTAYLTRALDKLSSLPVLITS